MALDAIDITVEERRTISNLLIYYIPNIEVWAYGSRVKWTSNSKSDLDLVVFLTTEQDYQIANLQAAFEESDLPFQVDIFAWNVIPDSFKSEIERDHVIVQEAVAYEQRETSDWLTTSWGELATLEYGKSLRDYRSSKGAYQVYGTNGPIGWHDEPLCTKASVIVGRKGANRGVHFSKSPFYVIDTAFYLEPKTEIDTRWAYYELQTHDINGLDSGSAIPSTSRSDFYNLQVKLPPLQEQRAIANILGTLDDKIDLNQRMCQTWEEMAQTLFKSWFINFDPVRAKTEGSKPALPLHLAELFPERLVETELGLVPEGWEIRTLESCFDLTMGQSPPGDTYNEEKDGLPFFQGRADFGFRYPNNRVFCTAPNRMANPDDTLVSVRAPVGDINMAYERCCIGRGVSALRHRSGSPSFTYYASEFLRPQLRQYDNGGTVFGSISKRQLNSLKIIEPPEMLIEAFDVYVVKIDKRIGTAIAENRSLVTTRDLLVPKLLSGVLSI